MGLFNIFKKKASRHNCTYEAKESNIQTSSTKTETQPCVNAKPSFLNKRCCSRCGVDLNLLKPEDVILNEADNKEYCDICAEKLTSKKEYVISVGTAQSKTYICARCKKEITDNESKWIGNHRFCENCAAPPSAEVRKNHLEKEAEAAAYQARMDYQRGSLAPDEAYSNRGFVKDKDGKWVYGKLLAEQKAFVCQKCGKELNLKYLHKEGMCVSCATSNKKEIKNNREIKFGDVKPTGGYRRKKFIIKLFPVHSDTENQTEVYVCYDKLTGIPYLVKETAELQGHAWVTSSYGDKLTHEQVRLFAEDYAPDSPLVNIDSNNWKQYFHTDNNKSKDDDCSSMNSVTRMETTVFLSYSVYLGSLYPIQLDWKDIEGSSRFYFACEPHFDEISIGLIKQGKYANQLFITIINDGYPSRSGGETVELLPERYRSYDGIKQYVTKRGFGIYNPISEDTYNKSMQEL